MPPLKKVRSRRSAKHSLTSECGVSCDSSGHAVVVAVVVGRTGRSVHSCDIYCCSGCRGRSNVGGDRCSVALVFSVVV